MFLISEWKKTSFVLWEKKTDYSLCEENDIFFSLWRRRHLLCSVWKKERLSYVRKKHLCFAREEKDIVFVCSVRKKTTSLLVRKKRSSILCTTTAYACVWLTSHLRVRMAAASSSGRELLRSPRLADSAAISRFFTQTGWLMHSKRVFTDGLRSGPDLSRVYSANTLRGVPLLLAIQ